LLIFYCEDGCLGLKAQLRFKERMMVLDMIAVASEGQIAAGRFVLRPVRRSDEGLVSLYAGDKRVAEATHSIPHPLPPGAAEAFVMRAMAGKSDEDIWVMDGSSTGLPEVLGVINLKRMDRAQSEIGFWVAPAFWNTGFASEAVQALVAANPHKDRTIFAEVFQDNPGSARVLTHAGFEYLGDAETFCVARNARVQTWTYIKKLG
jgi:RimJ/RimL family protein N-acetyltransferase